ncbi:hypothetical protein [Niveispirillum fermenti]|uniref:hypothetical protein n=1 Tax=Niveispirillum fermenti TaxID=1233113 RepID=UPI003A879E20
MPIMARGRGHRLVAAGALFLSVAAPALASLAHGGDGSCPATRPGHCAFTVGQEGVHRIDVTLPAGLAAGPGDIAIGGQSCPLSRQPQADGTTDLRLACFAYLTGGSTYALTIPVNGQVDVTRADPANGEPVTIIP